mgnify:CR=1 FL=1
MRPSALWKVGYVEGKRVYLVKEDYGQLLFEYYAAQYGLEGCLVLPCCYVPCLKLEHITHVRVLQRFGKFIRLHGMIPA